MPRAALHVRFERRDPARRVCIDGDPERNAGQADRGSPHGAIETGRNEIDRDSANAGPTIRRENEVTTDPSDRATLEEEYTLELRTRDRERKLLKKVEKSVKLIEDGEYGFCEETGEPIGIPRLLARPTATLSLEAQERRERMQKMYGE